MEKTNIITITNTLCISASLICVALTLWGNLKHGGMVSLETFIGVMVAFIGICATIIVGFQIINILELYKTKETIRELKEERKAYEDNQQKLENELRVARNMISSAFRALYRLNHKHSLHPIMHIVSIITYDPAEDDTNAPKTLYQAYSKLDHMIDNNIAKEPKALQSLVKKYLPDLVNAKIPAWFDNYDEMVKIRRRVISKIELL